MAYNNFTNEELRMQASQITDDSLQSTRRMKELLYESKDVGANTLVMLDEQGEQLEHVDQNLDIINQNMREVEKDLTDMEKCCGICLCPGRKKKNIENSSEYKNTWNKSPNKEEIIGKQPGNSQSNAVSARQNKGPYVENILGDDREDEINDNFCEVGNLVGELRLMATDMGKELEYQNTLIDSVTRKAEAVDLRVVHANARTQKMIDKK